MNCFQAHGSFGRTTRHIFYTTDKIGSGASCDVFKGVEKASGETRALKVFKDVQWSHSEENVREVEALSKISHRNIIGYYGKEEEYGTGRGVLVMEYCSGGSLHSFLQEPENINGLEDKEFLTFLNDTCQGWKYLRQCGFVHRDIKPGNILRDVKLDGSVTYKLADFGASKSVGHDDGEFMSLAGTEEYLHPAMYEQAFIHPSGQSVFTESADMWSFGVTIYHAATGGIPFKPFGGVRKNRSVMYMMITCKPSGAIAGDQLSASEDVRWRRTLPETCQLSPFIEKKTVVIIGGLLEADRSRQWTFRTLEDSVQKLVSLRCFTVVSTDEGSVHTVYTSKTPSVPELQEAIAGVTELSAEDQMLMYHGRILINEQHNQLTSLGELEEEEEIVLLVSRKEAEETRSRSNLGPLPNFSSVASVDEDLKTAVRLSTFLYLILLRVLQAITVQRGQRQALRSLGTHLQTMLYRVEKKFKVLSETCSEKQSRFETMKEMESRRKEISRQANADVTSATNKAKRVLSMLHQQLWQVKGEITSIRDQIHNIPDWTQSITSDKKYVKSHKEIKGSFHETKNIINGIKERKQKVPLSECEENMHKKDRNDLSQLCKTCTSQWQDYSLHCHRPAHLAFREAKSCYMRLHDRLMHVESVLDEVKQGRSELSQILTETSAFSGRAWKDVSSTISTLFQQSVTTPSSVTNDMKQDLSRSHQRLKSLLEDMPDLELFELEF